MGDLYLGSGDYEGAEREFVEEVRLNPGSAAAAYKLGLVAMNRGEMDAALSQLRRANELQPGMPETLLELGRATFASGDMTAAEKLFRQVLEHEDASSLAESAHFQLIQLYKKLGRMTDADLEISDIRKSAAIASRDSPWFWGQRRFFRSTIRG